MMSCISEFKRGLKKAFSILASSSRGLMTALVQGMEKPLSPLLPELFRSIVLARQISCTMLFYDVLYYTRLVSHVALHTMKGSEHRSHIGVTSH